MAVNNDRNNNNIVFSEGLLCDFNFHYDNIYVCVEIFSTRQEEEEEDTFYKCNDDGVRSTVVRVANDTGFYTPAHIFYAEIAKARKTIISDKKKNTLENGNKTNWENSTLLHLFYVSEK